MRLIPLTEAFRAVLRAWYPARPALADEIQNEDYFRSPFDKSTGWRLDPEVQIADFVCEELRDAIMKQQVRLRGRRQNKDDVEDIDPTEIKRTGILIFTNAVDRWQSTTRVSQFKQLPIYLNVHCYADDITALIGATVAPPAVVTKVKPVISPDEACQALIQAYKDSDRPKREIEIEAQTTIPGFRISNFGSLWKTYASPHQKRHGRRPRHAVGG